MGRDFRDKGISDGHVTGLISAYIDGALSVAEQEQVLAHIAACVSCRGDYIELKAAQRLLRAMPMDAPPRIFTLTQEMVGARPQSSPSFLARMLAPALAPRLATGSLLVFVLLLLVVVGDRGTARTTPLPGVTALEANNQSASAYNATASAAERGAANASATVLNNYDVGPQGVPKAALDTPGTDMANTPATPVTGGASAAGGAGGAPAATDTAQATTGMMTNNAAVDPPMSGTTVAGSSAATAPAVAASGNSSPTTVALAQPKAGTGDSTSQVQLPAPQQPNPEVPGNRTNKVPSTVSTKATNSFSPTLAIEAVLGALALALAVAAAIAKYRVQS